MDRPSSQSAKEYRAQLIRLIHVGKNYLRLDDDSYRAMLLELTGKASSAKLGIQDLDRVVRHLEDKGFVIKRKDGKGKQPRKLASDPQSRLIRHLWLELHGIGEVRDPSEAALAAFIKRQVGVEQLEWLSTAQASTLIERLKAWLERVEEGNDQDAAAGR